MNKKQIIKYKESKDKTLTTSQVIRDSFASLLERTKQDEYVIVENTRQKRTLIVQDITTFTELSKINKKLSDKASLLKEKIKENTFYLMKFENKNITFPEVATIADSRNNSMTISGFDIQITRQLINGWKYIINSPKKLDIDEMIFIQEIVAKDQALEWGKLRGGKVSISGTDYIPPIPRRKTFIDLLNNFVLEKNKRLGAAKLLIRLIKLQPFWDGNKRTAFLTINKLLLENNEDQMVINDKDLLEFNVLLQNYYNDDSQEHKLINFLISLK